MGYYVINFVSEAYTLQDENKCDRKISSACELVVKAKYLRNMKEKKKLILE